jgi:signal transduction histidine kinase
LRSSNEAERLHAVRHHDILDTPPEEAYDRIARLTARILRFPVAAIGFVDQDRIWLKSCHGATINEIPRSTSLDVSATPEQDGVIINDGADAKILLPAIGESEIKFYAAPLTTKDGLKIGMLCVIDTHSRAMTAEELIIMREMAGLVMNKLDLRLEIIEARIKLINIKSSADNAALVQKGLASTLVHELRSPLHSILGFAQLLERDDPSLSQLNKIRPILRAADHQSRLIDEFFELAVLKSGKESLTPESLSLSEVLNECQTMMKPQAQKKSIHLNFSSNENPLSVYADRTKLRQVLINLISNAIKYTPTSGMVTVQAESFSPKVRVNVKDTGIGIPPEKMDQLFQPYNRLGQESGPEQGMGIGLTVTKKLVEMMGGTIGVQSAEGIGSTFWFELPSAPAAN